MVRSGSPPASDRPAPPVARWAVLLVVLAAVVTNLTALPNGFTIDAQSELLDNRFITGPGHLVDLLTHDAWHGSDTPTGFWRPVTGLADWLLWRLSGGRPWSFMLAVTALHALAAGLVLALARRLGLSPEAAAWGTLLFAVHPVHVPVLATPLGLKDLLAAVLGLGAWLLFLWSGEDAAARRPRAALGAGVLIALALLAKESAAGILGAMVGLALFDRFRGGRRAAGGAAAPLAAWAGLAGAVAVKIAGQWAFVGAPRLDPVVTAEANPLVMLSPGIRLVEAIGHVGRYLRLLVLPWRVSPDYGFDVFSLGTRPLSPDFALGLVATVLFALLLVVSWRRRQRGLFALAMFAGATYAPVSNLLVTIPGRGFAARYVYLPSLAVCLLAAAALVAAVRPRRLQLPVAAGLVVLGFAGSAAQNPTWRDDYRLWITAHRIVTRNVMVAWSAATQYLLGEEPERALAIADGTLAYRGYAPALEPVMERWRAQFLALRARALLARGEPLAAVESLQRALSRRPDPRWCRAMLADLARHADPRAGEARDLLARTCASLAARPDESRNQGR